MYSWEIESLYASIPTEFGLEAIEYWIIRKRNLILQLLIKEFILESTEFNSKYNNFLFDSKMFNQIFGRVIGTMCTLSYACLTIGYQEEATLFTHELPKYLSTEDIL